MRAWAWLAWLVWDRVDAWREVRAEQQKTPNSVCAVSLRDNNDTPESEFSDF